jgi:hypothetical protein
MHRLSALLKNGLSIGSEYSGFRCLEQATHLTLEALERALPRDEAECGFSSELLEFWRATDKDSLAQQAMLGVPQAFRAKHNFLDICDRLPLEFQRGLAELDPGGPAILVHVCAAAYCVFW